MNFGRMEFASNTPRGHVSGEIVSIELVRGQVIVHVKIPHPHDRFDCGHWVLYGEDGSVIGVTTESLQSNLIPAYDWNGDTWVDVPIVFARFNSEVLRLPA